MSKARLRAVFEKTGGEEPLRKILRDFYHRMAEDILIGYFFSDKDVDSIADKQLSFLLFAVGMKPSYIGKSPTNAHLELPPILAGHFDRRLVILEETLGAHGLSKKDIRIWIDFEKAFRNVVQAS